MVKVVEFVELVMDFVEHRRGIRGTIHATGSCVCDWNHVVVLMERHGHGALTCVG